MKTEIKVFRDETKNYSPNFSWILYNIATPRIKKRNPYKLMLYMFLTWLVWILVSVMATNNPISYANDEDYAQSLQRQWEMVTLVRRCIENQQERLSNNKVITEDYCKKAENLEQFRIENTVSSVIEKNEILEFDIDRLAKAVAQHETWDCKLGYWKEYNNCFWIKNWNTAPCPKIWRNKMCIYEKPEDSYEAFKKIWSTWYKWMPNLEKATRWSWNDRAQIWLNNTLHFYNNNA